MNKLILYFISLSFFLSSCVKDTFDNPGNVSANVTSITIKNLREKYTGTAQTITALKIKGIVTSDKDGKNLPSQNLIIQDATAGIAVRFSTSHSFALNDEVEIVINGASLEEYNSTLQLNYATLSSATKTGTGSITPRVATLSEINNNFEEWESTLVKIDNATISGSGSTYNGSKTLADAGANITLYTTSTASFSGSNYRTGTVSVVGTLGQFKATKQLSLLSEAVVTVGSGGGGGGGGGTFTPKTIEEIRNMYAGTAQTINNLSIEGIVISDLTNSNTDPKNLVIQDGSRGIVVRFAGNHSFAVGDKVKIEINASLETFNGILQLNNQALAGATKTGTGTITPVTLTIAAIKAGITNYESTLVKITGATISVGTTYSTTNKITDATDNVLLYTRTGASFTGTSYPTGAKTITGIVSVFTTPQISIRTTADVQ